MKLRRAHRDDAFAIAAIYNRFVAQTSVSFETEPVSAAAMAARIEAKLQRYDWLVAERHAELLGYAYYGQFRERAAYDGTVETSVYLAPGAEGQGVATTLYRELLAAASLAGFRQAIGVITVPNPASEALHQRLGFERVGVLRAVGRKFEQDADVALWQRAL